MSLSVTTVRPGPAGMAWLSDRVAAAQSVRILIVVAVIPAIYTMSGVHGADPYVQGPGDPAPLHPTAAGELAIALADQQVLPKVEGLVPAPSPTPSVSQGPA